MRQSRRQRQMERARKRGPRSLGNARPSVLAAMFGFILVVGTLVLYSPMSGHEFINWDDDGYVLNNPHVKAGLSWETVRWSLTSTDQANWHPLTWLSHALDYQLFGLDAGGHHMTSLLIHTLNALLL